MSCYVKLLTPDAREFQLGKFNEGKKTDTDIALAAARKYKNLIRKLECGHYWIVVQRGSSAPIAVPVAQFRGLL